MIMKKLYLRLLGSSLAVALLSGCSISTPNSPPPLSTSNTVPKIGKIDDDSGPTPPEQIFFSVLLFPFTAVGALIDIPVRQIRYLHGDTPIHAARMTTDHDSPDNRREGLYKLVDYSFAHRPPYTTQYESMAGVDPDPTVRAAALRACNISRDMHAPAVFINALADKSELVRLEAAKGLCNLPDASAPPALLRIAGNSDENRDVRIASTDALKYYRTQEVARVLATLLIDRDYAIAFQAHRSLIYMTHKDFGFDQSQWLGFFAGPETPVQ